MKKLLTVLVLTVGFAFTSCSKDTCDTDDMIASVDGQTGSLSLSSLGVDVKEEGFGTSNESGRSIGEALYSGELVVSIANQTLRLALSGTASDIEATIAGQTIDGIPYGNQDVSVSISASAANSNHSRLVVSSATPAVIIGSSRADVTITLAPADAYLDVVATIANDVTSIETSIDTGYIIPGAITIVATATDVNGDQYVASVDLTLEAAKAYTVNFNASVDLNGGIVINATVTGFTNVDASDGVFNPVLTQIGGRGYNVLNTYNFSHLNIGGPITDSLSFYESNELQAGSSVVFVIYGNVFEATVGGNPDSSNFNLNNLSVVSAAGFTNDGLGSQIHDLFEAVPPASNLVAVATIHVVQ